MPVATKRFALLSRIGWLIVSLGLHGGARMVDTVTAGVPRSRAFSPLGIVASHRGSRSRRTLHLRSESPSPQEETQSMLVYCRIGCNFRAIIIIHFPAEFGPAPWCRPQALRA